MPKQFTYLVEFPTFHFFLGRWTRRKTPPLFMGGLRPPVPHSPHIIRNAAGWYSMLFQSWERDFIHQLSTGYHEVAFEDGMDGGLEAGPTQGGRGGAETS